MTDKKIIISIARQFGSGGADTGKLLAADLGISCYDKNILRMTSDSSGIKESYFHLADEKAGNRLLYRIINSMTPEKGAPSFSSDITSADNLFRFQSEVIKKLASEESCVIIGRCADYVLEGYEHLVRIRLFASMEAREARVRQKNLFPDGDIIKNIQKMDRERRDYYRYYTGRDWESPEHYDLIINTSAIGPQGAAKIIENYLTVIGYDLGSDFPNHIIPC